MNVKKIVGYIKKVNILYMLMPLVALILLSLVFILIPFKDIIFPKTIKINQESSYEETLDILNNSDYYKINFEKLTYTGYDVVGRNSVTGAYYYAIIGDHSVFVLLSSDYKPDESGVISNVTVYCKKAEIDDKYEKMLTLYAADISWTMEGLEEATPKFFLDNATYSFYAYVILYIILLLFVGFAVVMFVIFITYIVNPFILHPTFRTLRKLNHLNYKEFKGFLPKLDNELTYGVIMRTANTIVTKNYFIDLNYHETLIIPNDKLVWMYSYQHIREIFNKHVGVHTDMVFILADGQKKTIYNVHPDHARKVYGYYMEKYPNILYKYSEDNKKTAMDIISKNNEEAHKK